VLAASVAAAARVALRSWVTPGRSERPYSPSTGSSPENPAMSARRAENTQ
jgi:hypothetical protein